MRVKSARGGGKRSLEESFDGWQLGLAIVLFACMIALLVVPRPTSPLEIPEPRPSPAALRALRDVERAREARARLDLAPPLRALGGAVRALGRAEAAQSSLAISAARNEIAGATAAMSHVPPERIFELRAFQTASFVRAVRELERTGTASRDVTELGGDLVATFRAASWSTEIDGRLVVALDDDELGVAYRKRWNGIVSLSPTLAATTLTEEQLLFCFALRRARFDAIGGDRSGVHAGGARGVLRRIDEYARLDPAYPAEFARGVAHFGRGDFGKAQVAFANHLRARPNGPLTLRAQNFARAALIADLEGFVP